MLTGNALSSFFVEHNTRSAFRLETHQHLDVESDGDDFAKYLAGEPEPPRPWLDVLRRETEAGKRRYKVHVVREPLTDYLRFAMEWGYVENVAAGERIRIVDHAAPDLGAQDFWLLDDHVVLLMHYSEAGRFVGAEVVEDTADVERWRRLADRAWEAGTDFTTWWNEHPQYRRDRAINPRTMDDTTTRGTSHPVREDASRPTN